MSTKHPDEHPERASAPPSSSYRELERVLTPLPDSSHRPTPSEEAAAEAPHPPSIHGRDSGPAAAVRAALCAIDHLDSGDLEIDVVGGAVTLSGSVARRADREQIIDAIGRLPGVTAIHDHLRVRLD